MKNTPLYRVLIRNVVTGVEHVPGRYEVSTKIYSTKHHAVAAAKRLNSDYVDYPHYPYGARDLEAIVIETEVNWREILL